MKFSIPLTPPAIDGECAFCGKKINIRRAVSIMEEPSEFYCCIGHLCADIGESDWIDRLPEPQRKTAHINRY